jgi:hypothetical protein
MNASIAASSFYVDSLATILGKEGGFGYCMGPGAPNPSTYGASHGGFGSAKTVDSLLSSDGKIGSAYGDVFFPTTPGSGSCHPDEARGAPGGSSLQLDISEWSHVEGTIDMSGGDGSSDREKT